MKDMRNRYPHAFFPTIDGKLYAGDYTIDTLMDAHNNGPLYIYQKALIDHTVQQLREQMPVNLQLLYSLKANPWTPLVQHIQTLSDGFDTASAGELETVAQLKNDQQILIMTGPGKSDEDLISAITHNTIINLESLNELHRSICLASQHNTNVRVMLRLNPDFELRSSGMKMSGGPKPFGVDIETAPQLIQQIKAAPVSFAGIHVFCGSQCLDTDALIQSHCLLFERLAMLCDTAGTTFPLVNLGGGLGIPYFEHEQPINLQPIGDNLKRLIDQFSQKYADTTFLLELGRYLTGPCGIYACTVIDIKISRGKKFVITNGGMHHHLAASGNLGQVVRKNFPVVNASNMNGELEPVSVVGPLCTPLDILASDIGLPSPSIGDSIAIMQSGAYGLSASPQGFLSHPPCKQLLI